MSKTLKYQDQKDFFVYYRYDKYGNSTATRMLALTQYVHQKGELVLADDGWLFSVKGGGTGASEPHELVRMALKKTEVRVGIQTAEALSINRLPGITLYPEYLYQQALSGAVAFRAEGEPL